LTDANAGRFDEILEYLPVKIKFKLKTLPENIKGSTQEIRLRAQKPLVLSGTYGTGFIKETGRLSMLDIAGCVIVSPDEITDTISKLCGYSLHTHQQSINDGFVAFGNGHRAGIGGTASTENGRITGMRRFNSVNIRIAREHCGAGSEITGTVFKRGLKSVIISGEPSSGKTTVLRDLSRQLSSGFAGCFYKVAIIDERGEIAAANAGSARNDIGVNCDVLSCYPKGTGIIHALRSLSPEVIVLDEIGDMEEICAIEQGLNSGVKFIVSIHAGSFAELYERPQFQRLLRTKAFDSVVQLADKSTPGKVRKIIKAGEIQNEIFGAGGAHDVVDIDGRVFSGLTLQRVKELVGIRLFIRNYMTQLKYSRLPPEDILINYCRQGVSHPPFFILDCYKYINRGDGFHVSWGKAKSRALKSEDLAAAASFGERLGTTDIDGQLRHCEEYTELFGNLIESAREHSKKYSEIYTALGVLAGAAIVIMFL